jgi:hypothetical protein
MKLSCILAWTPGRIIMMTAILAGIIGPLGIFGPAGSLGQLGPLRTGRSGLSCLYAQDAQAEGAETVGIRTGGPQKEEAEIRYVLETVEYRADKRTRPEAMERVLDIEPGRSFESEEAMAAFLEEKAQELRNRRIFNTVAVTYSPLRETVDNRYYAAEFAVEDSWTFYPIPNPGYDSNYGLSIGLALDFKNFFGTLTRFRIPNRVDLSLSGERGDRRLTVPYWMVNPRFSELKIGDEKFAIGAMQEYDGRSGGSELDGTQFASRFITALEGKTAVEMAPDLFLNIEPDIRLYYAYRDAAGLPIDSGAADRFTAGLTYGFAYYDVNWVDNMKKGLQLELHKRLEFGLDLHGTRRIEGDLKLIAAYHHPVLIFNPSFRFIYYLNYASEWGGYGGWLRGIRNDVLTGWTGATLNTSLDIRTIKLIGYGELHLQPFFDVGFAVPREGFAASEDIKYAAGLEVILFIDRLRGFSGRLTFGIDFTHPHWDEFEKYEILVDTVLSY